MSNSSTTAVKWDLVHSGEVLMEDFIEGSGSRSASWPYPSVCHHVVSMRSCTASVRSLLTRRCVVGATSGPTRSAGSTCGRTMS